jgi:hypothetical protein
MHALLGWSNHCQKLTGRISNQRMRSNTANQIKNELKTLESMSKLYGGLVCFLLKLFVAVLGTWFVVLLTCMCRLLDYNDTLLFCSGVFTLEHSCIQTDIRLSTHERTKEQW